jgi:hypothetical protein
VLPRIDRLAQGPIRATVQSQLRQALEEQIRSALEAADVSLFALQQRATAANQAATTPADYLRAMFTPSAKTGAASSPFRLGSQNKGIVKTGPHGEWVLAIGATEQILPGRTTAAPSRTGYDVDVETGIAQAKGAVRQVQAAADQASAEGTKAKKETMRQRRKELRATGWQSSAFDGACRTPASPLHSG